MQPLDYATPEPRRRRWRVLIFYWSAAIAVGVLIVSIYLPRRRRVYYISGEMRDSSHLREIGQAMLLYANDDGGNYPDRIDAMLLDGDLTPNDFVSTLTNDTPATGPTTRAIAAQLTAGGHLSYYYCGKGLTASSPAKAVLAYGPSMGTSRWVLFGDGHVEMVPSLRFSHFLSELAAGHNPPRPLTGTPATGAQ